MPPSITEQDFQGLFQAKLGDSWERARKVFQNFGVRLGWDVTNVLLHATDQGQVDTVLDLLEQHYDEHLQFQHPDIRGTVENLGVNPTESLFLHIYKNVLSLQPQS